MNLKCLSKIILNIINCVYSVDRKKKSSPHLGMGQNPIVGHPPKNGI